MAVTLATAVMGHDCGRRWYRDPAGSLVQRFSLELVQPSLGVHQERTCTTQPMPNSAEASSMRRPLERSEVPWILHSQRA